MQENDADNIKEGDILNELKKGKCFMHGYDKKGNPIIIIQTRKHIPKEIPMSESKKFFLYMIDKAIKESDRAGTERITIIWDRNGFTKKNFDNELKDMFKDLIGIMQDSYSERMDTMIVLHPNWLFRLIYGFVKVFLTKRTTDKIKVLPELDQLQELIDKDQLLKEHGGTAPFEYNFPNQVFGNPINQQELIQHLQVPVQQEEVKPLVDNSNCDNIDNIKVKNNELKQNNQQKQQQQQQVDSTDFQDISEYNTSDNNYFHHEKQQITNNQSSNQSQTAKNLKYFSQPHKKLTTIQSANL